MSAHPARTPSREAPRLSAVLGRRWQDYERVALLLRERPPREPAVHDCRVAARRLITLLRLIENADAAPGARGLRRRVRRSLRALARLRDVHVEHQLAAERGPQHPALRSLARHLRLQERALGAAVAEELAHQAQAEERHHYAALIAYVASKETHGGTAPLLANVRRELARRAAAVRRRAQAMQARELDSLHAARVATKKLRYLLEVLQALSGAAVVAERLRQARGWQSRLGRVQDLRVLRDELAAYLAAHPRLNGAADLRALEGELTRAAQSTARARQRLAAFATALAGPGELPSPGRLKAPARPPAPGPRPRGRDPR
jgi:CHAD domain-containing protein